MIPPQDDSIMNLIGTVRSGLKRRGFHILLREDMALLFGSEKNSAVRLRRLQHFAGSCEAHCEADRELTVARFLTRDEEDDAGSVTLVHLTQTAFAVRTEPSRERVAAA